jgi:hypothetical protein
MNKLFLFIMRWLLTGICMLCLVCAAIGPLTRIAGVAGYATATIMAIVIAVKLDK